MIQPLWRTVRTVLKKLEIGSPYDPTIPLPGIYPEKTIVEREACTTPFVAIVFIIARTGKQPTCPSTGEKIQKLWSMYTMEHYSATKKDAFESVLMRWMNIQPII